MSRGHSPTSPEVFSRRSSPRDFGVTVGPGPGPRSGSFPSLHRTPLPLHPPVPHRPSVEGGRPRTGLWKSRSVGDGGCARSTLAASVLVCGVAAGGTGRWSPGEVSGLPGAVTPAGRESVETGHGSSWYQDHGAGGGSCAPTDCPGREEWGDRVPSRRPTEGGGFGERTGGHRGLVRGSRWGETRFPCLRVRLRVKRPALRRQARTGPRTFDSRRRGSSVTGRHDRPRGPSWARGSDSESGCIPYQ